MRRARSELRERSLALSMTRSSSMQRSENAAVSVSKTQTILGGERDCFPPEQFNDAHCIPTCSRMDLNPSSVASCSSASAVPARRATSHPAPRKATYIRRAKRRERGQAHQTSSKRLSWR